MSLKVCGKELTCEQYEKLLNHVHSIGCDVWEALTYQQKQKEIEEVLK